MNRRFPVMASLLCVCLVASNIFETKIFQACGLTLTGGFLIFPISYILNDCITELYGYRSARFVILSAFSMNLFFVLMAQLVCLLPGAPFWEGQDHFSYIFKADLRITAASMLAFLTGSLVNARIMALMKGSGRFGVRAILSSLAGETVDSMVFFPIAFWGVGPKNLAVMMITQILLKTMYEVVALPVTSAYIRRVSTK